jgi:hypothetical protein
MAYGTRLLVLSLVGCLLVSPRIVGAQEAPPPTSDLTKILRTGDVVWIAQRLGDEITGRVIDVSPSRLVVQSRNSRREIPFDELLRVRRRQSDPLWSGVIIGGAVGFGGPFVYCSAASESGETCGENVRDLMVTAAVGAGIGLFFDWLVKERKTVYVSTRRN